MLQSHPPRQIPLVVVVVVPTDGQNIAQSVDFELVKVAVDGGIEEGFELYDTCGDFGLLEVVEEGGVSLFCRCCFGTGGGIGGRGRLGEVEAEGLRCGLVETFLNAVDGAEDDGVDGIDDVVEECLGRSCVSNGLLFVGLRRRVRTKGVYRKCSVRSAVWI